MKMNPLNRGGYKGVIRPLFLLLMSAGLASSCGQNASQPPLPEVNDAQAKALSDTVADDLIHKNTKDLLNHLDAGFYKIVSGPGDLQKVMEKMYGLYGRPLKCDFKIGKSGVRTDGTWQRPSRTFLYAVKTTKYPMGKYFLQVEIVTAFSGRSIDVSGFGFFTFKDGVDVPDYLK
jgi:hypothetical protein